MLVFFFFFFPVYLLFSLLVACIFDDYSEKKIPSACLNVMTSSTLNFSYIDFIVYALSITELILCYLKILSSCQQLIQLKSLNAVEVNSSSFTYNIWNKMALQGLKSVSQARIKKLVLV